eukprot:2478960-Rhodomonas_salina.4
MSGTNLSGTTAVRASVDFAVDLYRKFSASVILNTVWPGTKYSRCCDNGFWIWQYHARGTRHCIANRAICYCSTGLRIGAYHHTPCQYRTWRSKRVGSYNNTGCQYPSAISVLDIALGARRQIA